MFRKKQVESVSPESFDLPSLVVLTMLSLKETGRAVCVRVAAAEAV
jgi:hypothetical protein